MMGITDRQKLVIATLLGLIVGFLLGMLIFSRRDVLSEDISNVEERDSEEGAVLGESDIESEEPSSAGVFIGDPVIEVKDQKAGTSIFITKVSLPSTGWAAVHEDQDGSPGNILGAKRFERGTQQGTMTLLRKTTAGRVYYVTLWEDDGDGKFDHKVDAPLFDEMGSWISMEFEAF